MASNYLVNAGPGPSTFAVARSKACGDDLGLVLTAIEFEKEKVSGGRVEEDRDYGGSTFQTFDEPIFIGSAIAQLAGHADAVILDSVDDWAMRLLRRFPDDPIALDAEVASVVSVMKARMSDLYLIVRPDVAREPALKQLLQKIVATLDSHAQAVIETRGGPPKALRGSL